MPVSPQRPKLRKREIAFALAMGALAAGGGAAVLSAIDDDASAPRRTAAMMEHQTHEVGEFEEISTIGPQDVVITHGDTHSVRSEGSPDALGLLEAVVEGGQLVIRPKEGFDGFSWGRLAAATFHVTLPKLEAVSLAGSGNIRVDHIDAPEFEGKIAGPGDLTIVDMNVDEADFTIAGPGNIVASGTAREARVSIAGSGAVKAGGLRSGTASVSIGGTGDAYLTVEDHARVSIMGSGDVEIGGPAQCSVSRMGSGNVTCSGSISN